MKTFGRLSGLLLLTQLVACSFMRASAPVHADAAEARSTAAEALIYGTPIVRAYGILYAHAVDPKNPEFQAPWNEIRHHARLAEPDDPAPSTPSLDIVTSWLAIDLRSEPLILTLPAMDKKRTYWVQLTDLLKNTPTWMSSRITGTTGGSYLLAKPGWSGEKPPGVKTISHLDSDLALAMVNLQVFDPSDLEAVKTLQSGITIQRMSAFLKQPAPAEPPLQRFVEPLSPDEPPRSLRFFSVLAFALQFCPIPPSERKLRTRLSRIGLIPGKPFDPQAISPEIREALEEGMADGWKTYQIQKKLADAKEISIGDFPGTPDSPRNPFMGRFAASLENPLELSKEIVALPLAPYDSDGLPLDGSTYRYVLHFYPDLLPPAADFWSLTLYDQPSGLLIRNPIHRYVLHSSMPGLKIDIDGGITFPVQAESPGEDLESNWLPASRGRFLLILRVYGPKFDLAKHHWAPPYLEKSK